MKQFKLSFKPITVNGHEEAQSICEWCLQVVGKAECDEEEAVNEETENKETVNEQHVEMNTAEESIDEQMRRFMELHPLTKEQVTEAFLLKTFCAHEEMVMRKLALNLMHMGEKSLHDLLIDGVIGSEYVCITATPTRVGHRQICFAFDEAFGDLGQLAEMYPQFLCYAKEGTYAEPLSTTKR